MSTETAAVLTSAAGDRLAAYHHPHFISLRLSRDSWGNMKQADVTARPFTGTEPEPERPMSMYADPELTHEDRDLINAEYDVLRTAWGTANYKIRVRPLMTKAAPLWKAYTLARKELDAVFAAFWETSDVQWKAQTLKLIDSHARVLAAARAWDGIAEELAQLQNEHLRIVGEECESQLDSVGTEFGIDPSGWCIGHISYYRSNYYRSNGPLTQEVEDLVQEHKARLRQVTDMVGDR
ncbi:hypothetical protein ACFV1L_22080 [Kitasatospora sp. NPDC059646]|uniref:hypothetical protein n=1 Tax=Kitasatospora sp. NPDC059646 TaxID=3346893 RepID=UPI0036911105